MSAIAQIFDSFEDAVAIAGKNQRITFWNQAAERLYGIPLTEALGSLVETVIRAPHASVTRDEILRRVAEHGSWRGNAFHETRDGRVVWVDWSVYRLDIPDLGICGTLEISKDISGYKHAEVELRDRTNFLESIVDGSREGIFVLDQDVNYAFINPACGKIVGHNPHDWLGRRAGLALHPDDRKHAAEGFFRALSGLQSRTTIRIMASDGLYRILDVQLSYLERGGKPHVLGIVEDITERRRAEQTLRESEEKYRSLSENIPGMVYRGRPDWTAEAMFNSEWVSGYSVEEFASGRVNWLDIIHPEDREKVFSEGALLVNQKMTIAQEYRIVSKAHDVRWVADHKSSFFTDDGKFGGVDGIVFDITNRRRAEQELREAREQLEARVHERTESLLETKRRLEREIVERKRAEGALRESEHRMRELVERMSSGVAVYEAVDDGEDFVFVDFNAAGERIEKLSRASVIGKRVSEVFPAVKEFGLLEVFRRVWRTGTAEYHPLAIYYRDERIEAWRDNFVYRLASGEVVAVYDDVTSRKRAEEDLQLLLRELDHRVKNTLATIASVAEQTLRSSASLEDFGKAFQGRIRALARMYEVGAGPKGRGLLVRDLVESMVAPFRRDTEHVSIRGDGTQLPPGSVRAIGMAIHELATNAAKYGAFSTTAGHVDVFWQVESSALADWLRITWAESDGPPVSAPSRRGLGLDLIEQGIAYELGGEVNLQFPVSGVRCEILIPFPGPAGGALRRSAKVAT